MPNTIQTPGFIYRGIHVPAIETPTKLIENLGTSKSVYELTPLSSPLSWRVCLYQIGRDLTLYQTREREPSFELKVLPTEVKELGLLVYNDAQERKVRGGWHKDAVEFLPNDQLPLGVMPAPETYQWARYYQDILGFEEVKEGVWRPTTDENTVTGLVLLPQGGGKFIAPNPQNGFVFDPRFGTPTYTTDKDNAIGIWKQAGNLTDEEAEKELSKFFRGTERVKAVGSWSYVHDGPLSISLSNEPRDRNFDIGSFPASRVADRSEAPANPDYVLRRREELEALEADREMLDRFQEFLERRAK